MRKIEGIKDRQVREKVKAAILAAGCFPLRRDDGIIGNNSSAARV